MGQFGDLYEHLENLKGKWLTPLGKASPFRIIEIDRREQRIIIELKGSSETKSRPVGELARLIRALETRPAIHVDSELAGSGSSRSQPETILAHIPGVEFLRIDRKKHLARVSERTRPYGTVREMDQLRGQQVAEILGSDGTRPPIGILRVVGDPADVARTLAKELDCELQAISGSLWQLGSGASRMWVSGTDIGMSEGTFIVFNNGGTAKAGIIDLGGVAYEHRRTTAGSLLLRT